MGYFTRIDPTVNMRRFYAASVQPTLFGEFALVREWGRIGAGGQVRSTPYPSPTAVEAALAELQAAKQRRGYNSIML